MMQEHTFAITFESKNMIENHRWQRPAGNQEALELEYDTITAQMLYWIFLLNVKQELARKNAPMSKVASELQLDPQHLATM